MGELNEGLWSVVSERGREASGLAYVDAAALVRRLLGAKIYGTCVVTDEAAARLGGAAAAGDDAAASSNGTPRGNGAAPAAKKRRAPRKKRPAGDAAS